MSKDELFGKGISPGILFILIIYVLPQLIIIALPLASLIANLMVIGKIGETYELAAIKAAGISLYRLIRPLVVVSVILAGITFYIAAFVVPTANLKFYSLLWDVSQTKPTLQIKPGVFTDNLDNLSILVSEKDVEQNKLYGIKIYDHRSNLGNNKVVTADSGRILMDSTGLFMNLRLYRGVIYEELTNYYNFKVKKYPFARTNFDSLYYRIELTGFDMQNTPDSLFMFHYKMKDVFRLKAQIDSMERENLVKQLSSINLFKGYSLLDTALLKLQPEVLDSNYQNSIITSLSDSIKRVQAANKAILTSQNLKKILSHNAEQGKQAIIDIRKAKILYHHMFSYALACIVFVLLGASLGAIIRKGGFGKPTVVAIFLFIMFFVVNIEGEKIAVEGSISPWLGSWLSVFIFIPVTIVFVYQSSTDSQLLSMNFYFTLIKKLREKLSKNKEDSTQ